METLTKPVQVVARVLLALIFVLAGINKLGGVGRTASYMAAHSIPAAHILVFGAIAMELGVGLLLMVGLFTRLAAFALFCYTLALALIFHPYWAAAPADAGMQHTLFYEHLSMMGGMLCAVALGGGEWSLDALLGRQKHSAGLPLAGRPAPHT